MTVRVDQVRELTRIFNHAKNSTYLNTLSKYDGIKQYDTIVKINSYENLYR